MFSFELDEIGVPQDLGIQDKEGGGMVGLRVVNLVEP